MNNLITRQIFRKKVEQSQGLNRKLDVKKPKLVCLKAISHLVLSAENHVVEGGKCSIKQHIQHKFTLLAYQSACEMK